MTVDEGFDIDGWVLLTIRYLLLRWGSRWTWTWRRWRVNIARFKGVYTLAYRKDRDVEQAPQVWVKLAQALVLVYVRDLLRIGEHSNYKRIDSEAAKHLRLHCAHAGRFGFGGSIAGTG